MQDNCAFCSIEVKERAIQEGSFSIVLLSNPRLSRGHVLVIPKRHIQRFSELTEDEIKEMSAFLATYQEKVLDKLGTGTEIRQNYRPEKKDSRTHVNHFHFNLMPRSGGDELEQEVDVHRRSLYKDLSDEEKKEVIELLE